MLFSHVYAEYQTDAEYHVSICTQIDAVFFLLKNFQSLGFFALRDTISINGANAGNQQSFFSMQGIVKKIQLLRVQCIQIPKFIVK